MSTRKPLLFAALTLLAGAGLYAFHRLSARQCNRVAAALVMATPDREATVLLLGEFTDGASPSTCASAGISRGRLWKLRLPGEAWRWSNKPVPATGPARAEVQDALREAYDLVVFEGDLLEIAAASQPTGLAADALRDLLERRKVGGMLNLEGVRVVRLLP